MPGGNLVLGKQPYPGWRPVQHYFLDADVNPEGVALRFERGSAFANLYGNNANGNTTYAVGGVNFLKTGYDVLEFGAQAGTAVAGLSLLLLASYAQNLADDVEHDQAWALGAVLGKAVERDSWEASALYQSLDKDALFGQIVDSDFGDGRTGSQGWVFKGGYAPAKNVTLNASFFMNSCNKDVGTELEFNRLQLDVNYKF